MKPGLSLDRQPPYGKQWSDFVKQGTCRVCKIPLWGWEPIEREVCGDEHCQAESKKVHPCRFKRLRNQAVTV